MQATTTLKINNYDDYLENHASAKTPITPGHAAKNPGSWANNLKVCYIDDIADQIIGVTTTLLGAGATIGLGVTAAMVGSLLDLELHQSSMVT